MNRSKSLLRKYLSLAIGAPANAIPVEVDGNIIPAASLASAFAQHFAWDQASSNCVFATSAGASITLTALQTLTQRLTNGGACTVTLDSAYNIVNTMQGAYNGQNVPFIIITNAGTTVATPTLSDTAVTLSGTTSVLAAAARWYQLTITQMTTNTGITTTAGTTFTSLTQVGSTNNYTVALGTNAIVPVVGQAVFLNVTAGTLPSGWYPINLVTSAVSFVIAAPNAAAAWTATAGTVGTNTVAPAVYSPLVRITGMMATVTATMSV